MTLILSKAGLIMNFNVDAELEHNALNEAKYLLSVLPNLGPSEFIDHLYAHWAVSRYESTFSDYNYCVPIINNKVTVAFTQDPRHNAVDLETVLAVNPNYSYAAHTYGRNSHALGVSTSGMLYATQSNFGPYPCTQEQLEMLCGVLAALGKKYNVDVSDRRYCMTHAEAALYDNYKSERWDWAIFSAGSEITDEGRIQHGDLIRRRIHNYKLKL